MSPLTGGRNNAFEESERRFRAVIEQASDGIGIMDPEGNMLAVNRRGCEMFGFSEEEILRLNFLDTITVSPVTLLRSVEWSQAAFVPRRRLRLRYRVAAKMAVDFPSNSGWGTWSFPNACCCCSLLAMSRNAGRRSVMYSAAVRERERIGRECRRDGPTTYRLEFLDGGLAAADARAIRSKGPISPAILRVVYGRLVIASTASFAGSCRWVCMPWTCPWLCSRLPVGSTSASADPAFSPGSCA